MGYTREDIISKCRNAIKDASTFYKQSFVNYRGRATDTGELYNEVIAEFVCDNLVELRSISCITRESSYKVEGHDGEYSENSNRLEEIIAMKMFNQCKDGSEYDFIGKIIDYQTPLKNKKNYDVGKIDLLSVNGNTIFVLELKKEDSTETMLRTVLEGYTYLKTVDFEKLKRDFKQYKIENIKASPLVFRKKELWKEMQEDRPKLKRLMKLLDSVPFYIAEVNNKYVITEE